MAQIYQHVDWDPLEQSVLQGGDREARIRLSHMVSTGDMNTKQGVLDVQPSNSAKTPLPPKHWSKWPSPISKPRETSSGFVFSFSPSAILPAWNLLPSTMKTKNGPEMAVEAEAVQNPARTGSARHGRCARPRDPNAAARPGRTLGASGGGDRRPGPAPSGW